MAWKGADPDGLLGTKLGRKQAQIIGHGLLSMRSQIFPGIEDRSESQRVYSTAPAMMSGL